MVAASQGLPLGILFIIQYAAVIAVEKLLFLLREMAYILPKAQNSLLEGIMLLSVVRWQLGILSGFEFL